jgi:hypothetical protein
MEGYGNSTEFGVIVVGAKSDHLVGSVAGTCERLAVGFAVCQDIYEVAAELAKRPAKRGMVVGRLEQLSREKGRLLEKAAQAGWVCCCIAKKIAGSARTGAIQAMKSGAIVLNDTGQLEEVMMRTMNNISGTLSRTPVIYPSSGREQNYAQKELNDSYGAKGNAPSE